MADTTPAPTPEAIDAWARLIRAAQGALAAVERDMKREGFPPLAWYDALLELRRAEEGSLRPYELQRAMLLEQYNLSRLTDRLVKAGYVERRPYPGDGRGHVLKITSAGQDLLKAMWPAYKKAISAHFAERLGERDAGKLGAILKKLL